MLKPNSTAFLRFLKSHGFTYKNGHWGVDVAAENTRPQRYVLSGNAENAVAYIAYYKIYFGAFSDETREFLASNSLISACFTRNPQLYNL